MRNTPTFCRDMWKYPCYRGVRLMRCPSYEVSLCHKDKQYNIIKSNYPYHIHSLISKINRSIRVGFQWRWKNHTEIDVVDHLPREILRLSKFFYKWWRVVSCGTRSNYSKTCLKQTCPKADTCLKRTKYLAQRYQFTGLRLINLTCLKQSPV